MKGQYVWEIPSPQCSRLQPSTIIDQFPLPTLIHVHARDQYKDSLRELWNFKYIVIINTYKMLSFPKQRLQLKKTDNLQVLVKKFIVHHLSAPHKQGIPELKENYAHVKPGPLEPNQEVVCA